MSYRELFSSIDCKFVVIIEDDFEQIEYKKERALYDITRMAIDDRCQYLSEIETVSPTLHEILSKFISLFDECFEKIGVWADKITRTPKNALAELLPAKVRHQTQFDKWANDLRSASIYSFRKTLGSECEVLQVEYQNRQYIANEVLDVILKDDSTELNLEMGKKAKIVKAKQKVYFEYYSK